MRNRPSGIKYSKPNLDKIKEEITKKLLPNGSNVEVLVNFAELGRIFNIKERSLRYYIADMKKDTSLKWRRTRDGIFVSYNFKGTLFDDSPVIPSKTPLNDLLIERVDELSPQEKNIVYVVNKYRVDDEPIVRIKDIKTRMKKLKMKSEEWNSLSETLTSLEKKGYLKIDGNEILLSEKWEKPRFVDLLLTFC